MSTLATDTAPDPGGNRAPAETGEPDAASQTGSSAGSGAQDAAPEGPNSAPCTPDPPATTGTSGGAGGPGAGTTTEAVLPRGPRRLRSLLIGVVIAGILAVVLFVGLGTGNGNSGGGGVTVGSVAPGFTLPRLGGGKPVNLDAIGVDRHRPVVLNFFASYCPPCQQESPLLAKTAAAAAAAKSPVQFVGVDVNDPTADAEAFVQQAGIGYPVAADRSLHVTSALYGINNQPNTFFIDASGHVVGTKLGALQPAELHKWVQRLTGSARQ